VRARASARTPRRPGRPQTALRCKRRGGGSQRVLTGVGRGNWLRRGAHRAHADAETPGALGAAGPSSARTACTTSVGGALSRPTGTVVGHRFANHSCAAPAVTHRHTRGCDVTRGSRYYTSRAWSCNSRPPGPYTATVVVSAAPFDSSAFARAASRVSKALHHK
jgi:hypothetical protein